MPKPNPPPSSRSKAGQRNSKRRTKAHTYSSGGAAADARPRLLLREDSPDSSRGGAATAPVEYLTTRLGKIFHGDSLQLLRRRVDDASVDLIVTSPPFGVVRKKAPAM